VNFRVLIDARAAKRLEKLPKPIIQKIDSAILSLSATLALPERNSCEASSRKDGGFESLTTVFFTGLTMVPKRFESLISGTVEKSTAESARRRFGDPGELMRYLPHARKSASILNDRFGDRSAFHTYRLERADSSRPRRRQQLSLRYQGPEFLF
jgi:hypothetical protein